jgi:hypothetical protein
LLEIGDTRPRDVSDALRLDPGAAGSLQLVDQTLGVAPDALAKLLEFGL